MPDRPQTNILRFPGIPGVFLALLLGGVKNPPKYLSKSRQAQLIFDTAGLVACNSRCLGFSAAPRKVEAGGPLLRLSCERGIFLLAAVLIAGSATSIPQTD